MSVCMCICVCLCVTVGPVIVSAASDEVVAVGQSVTLHCQATAVPPVAVVWRHNTRPVVTSDHVHITGV